MRCWTLAVAAALCGCEPTEQGTLTKTGNVDGQVKVGGGLDGAAWLFLYQPGEGPPGAPAVPQYATAISAERRRGGDGHFVFAQVKPNAFRLFGLLDVDGDFDPQVDVLAQPTAGDRVGAPLDLQVQPGRGFTTDYAIDAAVTHEPPAFRLEGVADRVTLSTELSAPTILTLVSDTAGGRLDSQRGGFTVGLLDADHDLVPDDVDGDGVPELSLQLFLRWRSQPGQLEAGATLIVPLLFNVAPFLLTLNNRLDATVTVTVLQATLVPQAVTLKVDANGQRQLTPFGLPPTGDYELVALMAGGQFWRVPNQLAPQLPSQAVVLHYDRTAP